MRTVLLWDMADHEPIDDLRDTLVAAGWRTFGEAFGELADRARELAGEHPAHRRGDIISPSLIDLVRRQLRFERSNGLSLALPLRAVACTGIAAASGKPKWRWLPAMRELNREWRCIDLVDESREDGSTETMLLLASRGVDCLQQAFLTSLWLPDFDDSATLGCLIFELLPEAWGDPWFSVVADGDGRWRCVGSLDYHGLYGYETRKEAAVAALEAAP